MVRFYDAYTETISKYGNENDRKSPEEAARRAIIDVAETRGTGLRRILKWRHVINESKKTPSEEFPLLFRGFPIH